MNEQVLKYAPNIIQTVGIVIAVITLIVGYKNARKAQEQNKKSRDLTILLNLSTDFRNRWEDKWYKVLDKIGADYRGDGLEELPDDCRREVTNMLNWVDWLGTIIRTKILSNEEVIFVSIGAPIRRIINAGRPIIEEDVNLHGKDYWGSLLIVGQRFKVGWTMSIK